MKNLVVDIQRCSLHDGPGIRTTIFLKGCPLRCAWCHNPESQSFKPQLSFNSSKCIGCFKCVEVCETKAHFIKDNKHEVDFNKCNFCGKCVDNCSVNALSIVGKLMSTEEIMNVVMKDRHFYESSGGGVTISGGEALANINSALSILKECKKLNIHTCIETSGYTSSESISKIIDYVDIFLYDFKLSKDEDHIKYTGASNELILKNLEYIYNKGKSIILRCPIIPSVNDNIEHFSAIRDIALKYKNTLKIELLPYHDFGIAKSNNIGRLQERYSKPTEQEKQQWLEYFKENNIYNVS